jgi:hypothetical protein
VEEREAGHGPRRGEVSTFSLEVVYEIWDDRDGNKIEVGPDRDGLGLVEIRDQESKVRLTLPLDKARLLATALTDTARRLARRTGEK